MKVYGLRAVQRAAYGISLLVVTSACAFGSQPSIVYTRAAGIVHQYPLTGSREVPPGTDIGIRAIGAYDAARLAKQTFTAVGSRSGVHPLTVHLSRDRTMAIFHAATPFAYGEEVRFAMRAMLSATPANPNGMTITDTVHFNTMVHPAPPIPSRLIRDVPQLPGNVDSSIIQSDSLPAMTVTVNDSATPGTIYFDNFGYLEGYGGLPNACFNLVTDQNGAIDWDQELPGASSRDFKPQPNGMFTFLNANSNVFYGMDSSWNVVDTFIALNYGTDQHELRVFPDGSYALFGISISFVDLSQLVPNGADSAEVLGDVIQIFDPDKNLVFQWRGIDHYDVIDSKYQDLTSYAIDFEHANSLDFDSSGNILISNRHLCEISCINGMTGDFIWRLGGAHNQFKLVGDSIWFSMQHDARWIPNGDMTLFDNAIYDTVTGGNGTWIQHSRALEYALDTTAMTATLVWQYHHTPETFSNAMGSVERLPNGNTFIGWGDDTAVSMTEVRPDNTTAFEMVMHNQNVSYRAYKSVPDLDVIGILDTTSAQVSLAPVASNSGNTLEIVAEAGGTLSAQFALDHTQPVSLTIYDVTGRQVRSILTSELESSGTHEIPLDLSGLPAGAYECVLTTQDGTLVRGFSHY